MIAKCSFYEIILLTRKKLGDLFYKLLTLLTVVSILVLVISMLTYLISGKFDCFGYRIMVVASESMYPVLEKNHVIIGRAVKEDEEIEIGGIYTYKRDDLSYSITHRIIGTDKNEFIFKGDNNPACDDAAVSRDNILYRIIMYPNKIS